MAEVSSRVVPRRETGRRLIEIEPSGAYVILRWRGRVVEERRWLPEGAAPGEWKRETLYPERAGTASDGWAYGFTRGGLERSLRRWCSKQDRKAELRAQREEFNT